MKMNPIRNITVALGLALPGIGGVVGLFLQPNLSSIYAQDELKKEASWKVPKVDSLQALITGYLASSSDPNGELKKGIEAELSSVSPELKGPELLDLTLKVSRLVAPDLETVFAQVESGDLELRKVDVATINQSPAPDWVKANLKLGLVRALCQKSLFDEALSVGSELHIGDVIDPTSLIFFRAVAQHQLINKTDAVANLNLLLENESELPKRYEQVTRLMLADLEPFKPDSLDEVARLMEDIRRRQEFYRSGKKVREEEDDVVKKLDKLIEEMEKQAEKMKQQQQQQQQQQQDQQQQQQSNPAQQSKLKGGKAEGEVDRKNLKGGQWGDVAPSDRAAAMAELAKDLPPHYRELIEEYFRRIADDQKK